MKCNVCNNSVDNHDWGFIYEKKEHKVYSNRKGRIVLHTYISHPYVCCTLCFLKHGDYHCIAHAQKNVIWAKNRKEKKMYEQMSKNINVNAENDA